MADIMLSTDMETKDAEKKISSLEKEIRKLENKKIPLETQMNSFNAKAQEARKTVSALKKEIKSVSDLSIQDKEGLMKTDGALNEETYRNIAQCKEEMQKFESEADKAGEKIEAIDSQIETLKARIDSLKFTGTPDASYGQIAESAKSGLEGAARASEKLSAGLKESKKNSDELGNSVNKVDKATGQTASGMKSKLGSALKSTGKSFDNFGKRIANTFKSALVFSVLYKGLSELKQRLSAMLSTNQQFSNSLTQVKSNLAVAFQPIYQAAMPAINALLNLLVKATAYLAAFTNALLGTSMDSSIDAARKMQNSINAVQSGASGASAAEKQLTAAIKEKQSQVKALQRENKKLQREYESQKKAVEAQTKALEKQIDVLNKQIDSIQASEDALNKTAEAQRNAIQANIDALQKQQDAISKESSAVRKEQEQAQKAVDAQKAAIDKQIKSINNQIKALQKKQKAEEKAKKENEKFTADFDELSTLGSVDADDPYDVEIGQLQEQIDILQERKEAIEDVDYSARLEALDAENEKIQEQIDLLQEQQDAIKDVDFSGRIDAYESQIASLNEKINELNDSVVENPLIEQNEIFIEQLQEEIDLLQERQSAIQAASDTIQNSSATFTPTADMDGITEDVVNWCIDIEDFFATLPDKLSDFAKSKYDEFEKDVDEWGNNLETKIEKFCTETIPQKFDLLDEKVTAKMDEMEGSANKWGENLETNIQKFFEETIPQKLDLLDEKVTAKMDEMEENAIDFANGGIDAAEGIINAIIRGLNWCAERINDIFSFEIPDWIPKYGGKTFSANLGKVSEVSLERIPVPALAQGTVIPPNKPFLAWLGDQKSGTNIEAPLSTIEDAFRNVVGEMDFNYNFTADGSLGALIRVLKLGLKREGKRETAFE